MAIESAVINTPAVSKINWVSGIAFLASVAAIFGLDISAETQAAILQGITLVGFPLIAILRTFLTKKP